VFDGLDGEIHVQLRPPEVVLLRTPDVQQSVDRRLAEPRELLEREEQLPLIEQQP